MKAYERREAGRDGYCNLDVWNARIGCWSKSKGQHETPEAARRAARKPGRYRVSQTTNGNRIELEPFEVA